MLPRYEDIRKRLGEPQWYDRHGVPRYDPFKPNMVEVYANYVALIEINCQYCGAAFYVSQNFSRYEELELDMGLTMPSSKGIGHFHYGDPPVHDCVGDTMNCVSIKVIQFWTRELKDGKRYEWERRPEFEVEIKEE